MVEAFRLMINENLRLDESSREIIASLDDVKNRNDNKIKKLAQDNKKSFEDTNNSIKNLGKNNEVLNLQLKDTMKRDREALQATIDDKYTELKLNLSKIEELLGGQEDSKKILNICKQWIRDSENKLEHKINNTENNFSELLIRNIQVRKIIGYSCIFSN